MARTTLACSAPLLPFGRALPVVLIAGLGGAEATQAQGQWDATPPARAAGAARPCSSPLAPETLAALSVPRAAVAELISANAVELRFFSDLDDVRGNRRFPLTDRTRGGDFGAERANASFAGNGGPSRCGNRAVDRDSYTPRHAPLLAHNVNAALACQLSVHAKDQPW